MGAASAWVGLARGEASPDELSPIPSRWICGMRAAGAGWGARRCRDAAASGREPGAGVLSREEDLELVQAGSGIPLASALPSGK